MRRPTVTRSRGAVQTETSLHMQVEQYLRAAWPSDLPYTHFPAGEKRDERVGGKLKKMGLKAGWPDFQFILPNGQAAFIELKRDSSDCTLSGVQIDLRQQLVALKCAYAVCRSVEEVDRAVSRWLTAFGRKPRASLMQRNAA